MNRYTLKIDGMKCPMCEEHVSTLIKDHVNRAIKVKASHNKNTCTVLSDVTLDEEEFQNALQNSGYRIKEINRELNLKDTFFFTFSKKHYKFYKKD